MFNFISFLIFLLPLLLLCFFLHKWFLASIPLPNQPPSPPKLPLIGNLHQLDLFPHRSLQFLSNKYGPLMLLHLGSVPVLIASSSDAAREIMKTHDLIFSSRPKVSIPDRLFYGSKDVAFAPYGEYWRQIRSICVLHLLSNKRVQSYRNIREEETSLMITKIAELCSSSSSSATINLTDLFVLLANDIVCRVALGRKYSHAENGAKFKILLKDFVQVLGTLNIGDYIPWLGWVNWVSGLDAKVEKVVKGFDEFIEGVVEEHRKKIEKLDDGSEYNSEGGGLDFVDILLKFQREDVAGHLVQNDTIKALIWDMFAAGTDTTQTVIEWAMSELLRSPNTLQKLQKEVREIAKRKSEICEEDVESMEYLKAVIKETLRLHAPVPLLLPRKTTQDTKLMGYDIKAGTQVIINAFAIGRDCSFWEEAEEFNPERFLKSSVDFRGFDFELIPFGAGRRGCPGVSLGIAVNELALAKLVHRFNFSLPKGVDLDMSEASGITVHRKFPLVAIATLHGC